MSLALIIHLMDNPYLLNVLCHHNYEKKLQMYFLHKKSHCVSEESERKTSKLWYVERIRVFTPCFVPFLVLVSETKNLCSDPDSVFMFTKNHVTKMCVTVSTLQKNVFFYEFAQFDILRQKISKSCLCHCSINNKCVFFFVHLKWIRLLRGFLC